MPDMKPSWNPHQKSMWPILLAWGVGIACGFTLLGLLGPWVGPLDFLNHFKWQYLLVQFLGLVVFLSRKTHRLWVTAGLCAAINLSFILPFYQAPPNPVDRSVPFSARLKVVQMNLLILNRERDRALQVIQTLNPDVIGLEEVDTAWQTFLSHSPQIKKQFPYRYFIETGELALFSRLPVQSFQAKAYPIPAHKHWVGIARISINKEKVVTVMLMHPHNPILPGGVVNQARHVEALVAAQHQLPRPLVVIGDFNMTPWIQTFRRLQQGLGLKNSMTGFGLQTSWPSYVSFLGIPIDHCLVSEEVVVLSRKLGPYTGSDHLPVVLELGVLPQPFESIRPTPQPALQ